MGELFLSGGSKSAYRASVVFLKVASQLKEHKFMFTNFRRAVA